MRNIILYFSLLQTQLPFEVTLSSVIYYFCKLTTILHGYIRISFYICICIFLCIYIYKYICVFSCKWFRSCLHINSLACIAYKSIFTSPVKQTLSICILLGVITDYHTIPRSLHQPTMRTRWLSWTTAQLLPRFCAFYFQFCAKATLSIANYCLAFLHGIFLHTANACWSPSLHQLLRCCCKCAVIEVMSQDINGFLAPQLQWLAASMRDTQTHT